MIPPARQWASARFRHHRLERRVPEHLPQVDGHEPIPSGQVQCLGREVVGRGDAKGRHGRASTVGRPVDAVQDRGDVVARVPPGVSVQQERGGRGLGILDRFAASAPLPATAGGNRTTGAGQLKPYAVNIWSLNVVRPRAGSGRGVTPHVPPDRAQSNMGPDGYTNNVGQPKANWKRFTTRHHGGGFLLFADGHVAWYGWGELQPTVNASNPGFIDGN
jgi:hypothetical protein